MGYGEILKRSFEAVKKYRWLLVWAVFWGAIGGGVSFNFNSNWSASKDSLKTLAGVDFEKVGEIFWETVGSYYWEIIRNIPSWVFLVIIAGVLINIVYWFLFGIFTRNWAKGGMIKLSYEAVSNGQVDLGTGSLAGVMAFWRLFLASLLIGVVMTLGGLVFGLLSMGIFTVGMGIPIVNIFLILLWLGVFLAVILGVVFLLLVQIYADWSIVIDKKRPVEAVCEGFEMVKRKFLKILGMGAINKGVSCLASLVLFMVMLFLGGLVFLGGVFLLVVLREYVVIFLPVAIILLILLSVVSSFFSATVTALRFNNWSLIFKELKGEFLNE